MTLLVPAALAAWTLFYTRSTGLRIALVRSLLTLGTAAVVVTEALSASTAIDRASIAVAWSILLILPILFIAFSRSILHRQWARPDPLVAAGVLTIGVMSGVIAWTAILSPPNSADAMAYHMPRIVYWVQHKSVGFFPTTYLNQIMLQPVAEYIGLHLYLLAGGDRFINLVQVAGYAGSVVAVSSIAGLLGGNARMQTIAALFCATLPSAILQASGAKNDTLLSFWLAAMMLCAGSWLRSRSTSDLVFTALALGLSLGTKGTAYLFAAPFLLAIALRIGVYRLSGREIGLAGLALALGTLLINTPQYVRNLDLSGSILGFDSAQGDGVYRWSNETFGWKATLSNILRNTSEQLGGRSDSWNRAVYEAVLRIHNWFGLDPEDPKTTWRYAEFRPPVNANHEANANNRLHLGILAVALLMACYRAFRRNDWRWLAYSSGPILGFLAFCVYLKWQPYFSRLELPLFVIAAPLAAYAIASLRLTVLQVALCFVFVSNARLALTQNWTRPLTGPNALATKSRSMNYFNDLAQFNNTESYFLAVDRVAASGCTLVGIDNKQNHLEYPLQALLLQRNSRTRFMHVGVENPSIKYASGEKPCGVICPDCSSIDGKAAQYSDVGKPEVLGRFLVFIRHTDPSPGRGKPSDRASE